MSTVTKTVAVTKEASELADAVVSLVKSVKKHGADGFQAGQDIPAVILENMQGLMKGVDGVDQLKAESKEDLGAFVNAWSLAGTELAAMFLEKDETEA